METANSSGPPLHPPPFYLFIPFQSLQKKALCWYKTEKEVAGRGRVSQEFWGGGREDLFPNYFLEYKK